MAAEAGKTAEDYLCDLAGEEGVGFYNSLQTTRKAASSRDREPYPEWWPRVPRTQEDPEVKNRRTIILQEMLAMVTDVLGEFKGGPGKGSQSQGWKDLPQTGGGTLAGYLLRRLTTLWEFANAPVEADHKKRQDVLITAADRNTYLTTLLKPPVIGPPEVKGLVHEIWPVVKGFRWVTDCGITLESEVTWLEEYRAH